MKIRTILLTGCLISLGACDESKYDLDQLVPERYHKILYLENSGKQDLTLYDTDENNVYTLSVVKAGSQPDLPANADVSVLTQEELDKRSNQDGIVYKRISEDSYSLDETHLDFGTSDRYKEVTISLNPQKIKASLESEPDAVWVLPLQVVSASDSVNAEKNEAFLQIKAVVMPALGFKNTSVVLKKYDYGTVTTITENVLIGLDTDNKWELECELEVDAEYVATYNTANGTVFQSLPENGYSMVQSMKFPNGTTDSKLAVTINADQLKPGDYMLPIRIKSVNLFEISSTKALYPLTIRIAGPQLNRAGWIVEANTEELTGELGNNSGPVNRILDGDLTTYWHSQWQNGSHDLPHELIIDAKKEHTFAQLAMMHRSGYTDVGSGTFHISSDKNSWTKVGNFTMKKEQGTQMFGITPTKGRYIKIVINQSNRDTNSALAEVYAYGLE